MKEKKHKNKLEETRMKKIKSTAMLLAFAILLGLAALLPAATSASKPITVTVNGKTVEFPDVQPFVDANGRTFVPVRFVSEELNCEVEWHPDTRTVTIDRGRINAKLTIGKKEITVLGVTKTMNTAAQVQNGRTLVPARFVAEAFGCEVEWDGATRVVKITDPGKDVYKIGTFSIEIEESDRLSRNSVGGVVVVKKSGLSLAEGDSDGRPVLRVAITINENSNVDVPKQRQEIEVILKQCLSVKLVDEVIAYAANLKTIHDELDTKVWGEGRYRVVVGGGYGAIFMMIYIN